MFFYILLISYFIILFIIGVYSNRSNNNFVLEIKCLNIKFTNLNRLVVYSSSFFSLFILFILTGFRSIRIGNDTVTYVHSFLLYTENYNIDSYFEKGYYWLNIIIAYFTNDPHYFIVITSAILYICISYYLYSFSKNLPIAVFMFFCLFFSPYLNIIRQAFAMTIVLYAYQSIKHNKLILGFLLIYLATLFHTSAYACYLLYIKKLYIKKNILFISIILALLVMTNTFDFFFVNHQFLYYKYFSSEYHSTGQLGVSIGFLRNLIFLILVYRFINNRNTNENKLVITNFALLFLFSILGYSVNLFTRVESYFLLIGIVELSNILYVYKDNVINRYKNKVLICLCLYLITMFVIILILKPEWNRLYPYEFWSN